MEEKKHYELEFKGSYLFALVPLILFVVGCILFFVVFKTYNMMDLCTGGFAALLIGSLFSKKWSVYWKSVFLRIISMMRKCSQGLLLS